jgi:hypothetical protein
MVRLDFGGGGWERVVTSCLGVEQRGRRMLRSRKQGSDRDSDKKRGHVLPTQVVYPASQSMCVMTSSTLPGTNPGIPLGCLVFGNALLTVNAVTAR